MKKILLVLLLCVGIVTDTYATSEPEISFTGHLQTEFENTHGATCKVATDGCNEFSIENAKVGVGTQKLCESSTVKWECIENIEEDLRICTMEYAPVCGINGVTYGNMCGAGDTEIAYGGECNKKGNGLSQNDQSFYNSIKIKLGENHINRIDRIITKYKGRLEIKYSQSKILEINQRIEGKVNQVIDDLLSQYPQDIGLPEKVNKKYFILTYLKFELMMYSYELEQKLTK